MRKSWLKRLNGRNFSSNTEKNTEHAPACKLVNHNFAFIYLLRVGDDNQSSAAVEYTL
jgi:hypothetical protein